ncbi:PspC domain-containing protein [Colwellia sp. 4_MG-2023]|jgi:phage shock protein PspC (stress-responsive transcriptional regulator)|uniref:PspC domain-containing protein n=1 Tax=unclassified Colwellia TaxID=196834 RepID=UPI001C086F04|nr:MULTISPECIES: PspC domain-containing protein [unclassified Colwellia]MBU2924064.1 PspC domain-containing protein [Colwellia sp. C2M11]MDO6506097.1 PspC domain-containing protein [Colwellia sp. 5_MG-2023]MDO6554843.1 PspC domain-containing protein [Colwellia sp. 4_MG-2023]MDO6651954.1 PspC domain-containing protein [Colwellia sp. 3_MG-2023]MDO6664730.1 PspC domain-containing protein [Colwellia sp. 2_MG-2023]
MKYEREFSNNQNIDDTLTKDSVHKKVSGVCAGIAKHYDFPRIAVRIATLGALILFPFATGVAYVVASVLLPESKYR